MPRSNAFTDDPVFRAYLERLLAKEDAAMAWPHLESMGRDAATVLDELATEANANPPTLADDGSVQLHPSYIELAKRAYGSGLVRLAYRGDEDADPLPRVATFGMCYLYAQAEQGHYCPVCLTDGTARLVDRFADDDHRDRLLDDLLSPEFDELREGAMWMTEEVGGSDVSQFETEARVDDDGQLRLWGAKYFCSNANAHMSAVLARAPNGGEGSAGLGLYLVETRPGWGPDADYADELTITALKDKHGTRSMATGEVEMDGVPAIELGGAGEGLKRMVEMLTLSRIHNAVASAGNMRRCAWEAVQFAREREAFGRSIADHPLHRATLLELVLEAEGATAHILELARLLDLVDTGRATDQQAAALRILTPIAKLSTAGRAVIVASAAMEAHGGRGYIRDTPMPRFLADAQVLPIWEGTTNVLALDMLRAVVRERAHRSLINGLAPRLQDAGRVDGETADHLSNILSWVSEDLNEALEDDRDVAELRSLDIAARTARAVEAVLMLEHANHTRDEHDVLAVQAYVEAFITGTRDVREDIVTGDFHDWLDSRVPPP